MDTIGGILIPIVLFEAAVIALVVVVYKTIAAEESSVRQREIVEQEGHG